MTAGSSSGLALVVLRNRWLAYLALLALLVATTINREALLRSGLGLGILSVVAAQFAMYAISELPITLDASAWFATRSAIVAGLLVALAAWSFYPALGGRSALGSTFEP